MNIIRQEMQDFHTETLEKVLKSQKQDLDPLKEFMDAVLNKCAFA